MRTLILFVLAAMLSLAQTKIPGESLRGNAGSSPRIWIVLPNGTLAEATLEGLVLEISSEGKPVLRVGNTAAPVLARRRIALTTELPTLTVAGVLNDLYRNGILQFEGQDYTVALAIDLSSTVVTFIPGAVPKAGDLLTVKYCPPQRNGAVCPLTKEEVQSVSARGLDPVVPQAGAPPKND